MNMKFKNIRTFLERRISMKETDYITILSPMVSKLKLSGNNLIIFALIHGFTKDGEHNFNGSLEYICQWTNLSKSTVIATLKALTDNGFINKTENFINNVKFCSYNTNYDKILKNLNSSTETIPHIKKYEKCGVDSEQGGAESEHNIDKDNYNDKDKEDNNPKKLVIDYDFIKSEWQRINPNLASIRGFNDKRKNAIKNLLKKNNACIDDLIKTFEIISICSFCNGSNDRLWKATFDWLIADTKSCFNRLLEGDFVRGRYEKEQFDALMYGECLSLHTEKSDTPKFQF